MINKHVRKSPNMEFNEQNKQQQKHLKKIMYAGKSKFHIYMYIYNILKEIMLHYSLGGQDVQPGYKADKYVPSREETSE